MARFELTVKVEYVFDVEADSIEEAEGLAWEYEDHRHSAEVEDIEVHEYPDEDEEEGE
jgi:hypothetical protein